MKMKLLAMVMAGALAGGTLVAMADGWATTYALTNGTATVSNAQANSSWTPLAVLWKFPATTNTQLTVYRQSQGNTFVLSQFEASNTASVVWVPEAAYPFAFGDALLLTSSVSNGQVQVIRKGN